MPKARNFFELFSTPGTCWSSLPAFRGGLNPLGHPKDHRRVDAVMHFVLYAFPKGIPAGTVGYDLNPRTLAYESSLLTAEPQVVRHLQLFIFSSKLGHFEPYLRIMCPTFFLKFVSSYKISHFLEQWGGELALVPPPSYVRQCAKDFY